MGFIENINRVADNVDAVNTAAEVLTTSNIKVLDRTNPDTLNGIAKDLKKGTNKGFRKLDVDLVYNIVGVTEDTTADEANDLWNNANVTYDKAIIEFAIGNVEVPFVFDGNSVSISTCTDLLAQLLNSTNYTNTAEYTSLELVDGKINSMLRVTDSGGASNIIAVTLHADSGDFVDEYYRIEWLDTTSCIEVVGMNTEHIFTVAQALQNGSV
jgi:hypothetical protein